MKECVPEPLLLSVLCLCVYALMRSCNVRGAILPCYMENSRRVLNKARLALHGILFFGCVVSSSEPWLFFKIALASPLTLGDEIPLGPSEAASGGDSSDPAGGLHPVMYTSSLMQWTLVYTRAVHIARLVEHAVEAVLNYSKTGSALPKGGPFKSLYGLTTLRRVCSCIVLLCSICCPVMPLVVLKELQELAVAKLLHLTLYYIAERGLGVSRDGLNYCRLLSGTRALVDLHFLSKTVEIGTVMRAKTVWALLTPEMVNYFCTDHRYALVQASLRLC